MKKIFLIFTLLFVTIVFSKDINLKEDYLFGKDKKNTTSQIAFDLMKKDKQLYEVMRNKLGNLDEEYKDVFRQKKVVFYLFSENSPKQSLYKFLDDSSKLHKMGIKSAQFTRGFGKYFSKMVEQIKDNFIIGKIKTTEFLDLGVDHKIFEQLNLKSVPVLLYGHCYSKKIRPSNCDILFYAKGDITVEHFFKLIGDKNEEFNDLYFSFIEP